MALPARVGRYRVVGEIGRGAMGTVYRAVDESLDRDVAVKVMTAGAADPDARARFEREARAAARLSHPNIVVVYELGEHAGAPFMALELLEGTDLQKAIEDGVRPDPRATLPLVLQVLAGLGHAHRHGIVHRDVKPSNVFLPLGRPAKVMDFGVARLAGHGTTTAGTIVGTPNYMSPEQVAGGDLDGRSDLFSTGLILFELVTGERAVAADTVVAAMYKIAHETPDFSLIPAEPSWEGLRRVLGKALARDRDARYPTAAAMAEELGAALVALGGAPDLGAAADQALLVRRRAGTTGSAAVVATAPAPAEAVRPIAAPPIERRAMPRPPALRPSAPAAPERRSRVWLAVVPLATAIAGLGWLLARGPLAAPTAAPVAIGPSLIAPTPAAAAPATLDAPPAPVARGPAAPPLPAAVPTSPATLAPEAATRPAAEVAAVSREPPAAATAAEPADRSPEARLARTRDLLGRGRFVEALGEARALLDESPTNVQAQALAQQAEAELVVEDCLRNARAALTAGDRERALEELRRGFFVRRNDPRLLALHREAVRQ
jgi:serine/threonine-protein kinase